MFNFRNKPGIQGILFMDKDKNRIFNSFKSKS